MKLITAILATVLTSSTLAAEPTYTCQAEQGCREEQGPEFQIGRGAKLILPSGWRLFTYPAAPDPLMDGLREVRAVKDGMVIAITPLPNIDKRAVSENQLCVMIIKSGEQYEKQSKEKFTTPVSMSHGDVVGCYASFTAASPGEKPFAVLPYRRYASVSSFVALTRDVFFSVDLASEQTPDEDYQAALNAIRQLQ